MAVVGTRSDEHRAVGHDLLEDARFTWALEHDRVSDRRVLIVSKDRTRAGKPENRHNLMRDRLPEF